MNINKSKNYLVSRHCKLDKVSVGLFPAAVFFTKIVNILLENIKCHPDQIVI